MSYDPKCGELAEHFLPLMSSNELQDKLAQHIQDSIEEWLSLEADRIQGAEAEAEVEKRYEALHDQLQPLALSNICATHPFFGCKN